MVHPSMNTGRVQGSVEPRSAALLEYSITTSIVLVEVLVLKFCASGYFALIGLDM